jgi:hypothetical protein
MLLHGVKREPRMFIVLGAHPANAPASPVPHPRLFVEALAADATAAVAPAHAAVPADLIVCIVAELPLGAVTASGRVPLSTLMSAQGQPLRLARKSYKKIFASR